jgi:hypothetical protein
MQRSRIQHRRTGIQPQRNRSMHLKEYVCKLHFWNCFFKSAWWNLYTNYDSLLPPQREVEPLPETDDGDPIMESKYFDSRIDFLKHCQDNQFQFDTLRRAKHSTMMILYYLHNSTCYACHHAVDQCLVWRCLECIGCTFCDPCYKQNGESLHIHELRQIDTSKKNAQVPSCISN